MPRHYDNSMQKLFKDWRPKIIRKRDGLMTQAQRISHEQVENSLDAKFGKTHHFRYKPLGSFLFLLLMFFPISARAENAQLNSAIQAVSSQTTTLQGRVSTLGVDEAALIQRYHLTNAGLCNLWVVGVTTTSTIPISFLASTSPVTAVQADLLFSSSFTVTGSVIGPAASAAGKSIQIAAIPGGERVIVFGLNTTPIGSGLLATLTYSSLANTPHGVYPITETNLVASDAGGNSKLLCGVSGAIKL